MQNDEKKKTIFSTLGKVLLGQWQSRLVTSLLCKQQADLKGQKVSFWFIILNLFFLPLIGVFARFPLL
jgi:hypothetical protein